MVSADHPLVTAISENAEKLQVSDISMMPEGLVKISSSLYDTILPMVKNQVESQIKVRDLSGLAVTLSPADFQNWKDVRDELMSELKSGIKAECEAAIAAAENDTDISDLRKSFLEKERDLEHEIDHTVHTFSASVDFEYNFLSS